MMDGGAEKRLEYQRSGSQWCHEHTLGMCMEDELVDRYRDFSSDLTTTSSTPSTANRTHGYRSLAAASSRELC
jgi:hypothetical protein